MSMQGDIASEEEVRFFVKKLEEKIEAHKGSAEVVDVLKELGREILASLPNIPEWAQRYNQLFNK